MAVDSPVLRPMCVYVGRSQISNSLSAKGTIAEKYLAAEGSKDEVTAGAVKTLFALHTAVPMYHGLWQISSSL